MCFIFYYKSIYGRIPSRPTKTKPKSPLESFEEVLIPVSSPKISDSGIMLKILCTNKFLYLRFCFPE